MNKQGKFSKDKAAFAEGYAFKWSGRNTGRRGVPRGNHTQNPTTKVESDSSLSSSVSQQSTLHSAYMSTTNSSRKRLRYGGGTPPTNTKKDKKGLKPTKMS